MRALCLALACLIPTAAWAERPMTYREVLEGALSNNPTVGRAELGRDQATAALMGANGVFDPTFQLSGNYRRAQQRGFFQGFPFTSNSTSWDMGTSLSQTAPTGTTVAADVGINRDLTRFTTQFGSTTETETEQNFFTTNMNISITQQLLRGLTTRFNMQTVTRARGTLDVAELSLEQSRQQILATAAQAYWTWVYQDRVAELAQDSVEVAVEAARVGGLRVDSGDLAPVERTRLDAAVIQARTNLVDAEIAAQQAADAVLLLMGEVPGQDILPATNVDDVLALDLDPQAAVEVALAQNLEIAIAKAQLEQARNDRAIAKQGMLPSLSATAAAGVGSQEETASEAVSGLFGDNNFPFVSVGGVFSVPLGNRAARAESQRAGADVMLRELELEEVLRRVHSETLLQVTRLASAQRKVDLADVQARLAAETLAAQEALNDAGRGIQRELLEDRAELDRLEAEAAKARTDWRIAQVELLRLQGQLEGTEGL